MSEATSLQRAIAMAYLRAFGLESVNKKENQEWK
jgi:hypothetical protein